MQNQEDLLFRNWSCSGKHRFKIYMKIFGLFKRLLLLLLLVRKLMIWIPIAPTRFYKVGTFLGNHSDRRINVWSWTERHYGRIDMPKILYAFDPKFMIDHGAGIWVRAHLTCSTGVIQRCAEVSNVASVIIVRWIFVVAITFRQRQTHQFPAFVLEGTRSSHSSLLPYRSHQCIHILLFFEVVDINDRFIVTGTTAQANRSFWFGREQRNQNENNVIIFTRLQKCRFGWNILESGCEIRYIGSASSQMPKSQLTVWIIVCTAVDTVHKCIDTQQIDPAQSTIVMDCEAIRIIECSKCYIAIRVRVELEE